VLVSAALESRHIARESSPTWKSVLAKRELWILSISYMLDSYVLFIFIFWLYTYLTDVRGFSLLRGGLFASLPFIASTVMTPIGGRLCDWCCAHYGARRGRRIEPVICLLSSGFLLFVGAKVSNPYLAIVVLSFTFGFVQATEGAYWSTSNDIGPKHAGTSGGVMNMVGNLGGVFSTALVPILVQHFGWLIALSSGTLTALIAAALWFFVNVDRPQPGVAAALPVSTS
jgi:ACS family glucarate transporter-like MFS transporter